MRVLYIGGTGEISFDCIHESVRLGHEVTVFNRGHHNAGLPRECRFVLGDLDDDAAYRRLAAPGYDVVCQFRLFEPAALARDLETFAGRCGRCEYADLCGGSRARAYAATGDPLGEDPACTHQPALAL